MGVPVIGCDCAVCHSPDPRDVRSRSSALVEADGFTLLIDAGPDLRNQLLSQEVSRLDGVLFTHGHADHTLGIDDLRPLSLQNPVDMFAEPLVLEELQNRFPYCFVPWDQPSESTRPKLRCSILEPGKSLQLGPLTVTPIRAWHGTLGVLGFVISHGQAVMGYFTDLSRLDPDETQFLGSAQMDLLIVDTLRERFHPTHFNFEQALELVRATNPREAWGTHISHDLNHRAIEQHLSAPLVPGFDGKNRIIDP